MNVNEPAPPPEPEPIIEEQTDLSIEARIGAIEARLDALDASFSSHEHVEYSVTDHNHDEPESDPTTGAGTEDERPHAGHFWFKRIGE